MALISTKISNAKSKTELDHVISYDKLTDVEAGYRNSLLGKLATAGEGNEEGVEEEDEVHEWYNVDSLELTYSQELVLESAMSKATKADSKDAARAENGAPNTGLTLVRGKTYYEETIDEKTEIGEETIGDDLQSPPTEVIEVIDSDDESDDDKLQNPPTEVIEVIDSDDESDDDIVNLTENISLISLLQSPPTEVIEVIDSDDGSDEDILFLTDSISLISLNDTSCEQLPTEGHVITIDLTEED